MVQGVIESDSAKWQPDVTTLGRYSGYVKSAVAVLTAIDRVVRLSVSIRWNASHLAFRAGAKALVSTRDIFLPNLHLSYHYRLAQCRNEKDFQVNDSGVPRPSTMTSA